MGGVHNKHGMKNEYSYKVLFEELGKKRSHGGGGGINGWTVLKWILNKIRR